MPSHSKVRHSWVCVLRIATMFYAASSIHNSQQQQLLFYLPFSFF